MSLVTGWHYSMAASQSSRTWTGICAHCMVIKLNQQTNSKNTAITTVRFLDHNRTLETFKNIKTRADVEIPWISTTWTTSIHPCTYLPLPYNGRIFSNLYQLSSKLSSIRWSAGYNENFRICVEMFTVLSYFATCWQFESEVGILSIKLLLPFESPVYRM